MSGFMVTVQYWQLYAALGALAALAFGAAMFAVAWRLSKGRVVRRNAAMFDRVERVLRAANRHETFIQKE